MSNEDPAQRWRQGGSLGRLVSSAVFCASTETAGDEMGWAGYEALGDHARSVLNWPEAEAAYTKALNLVKQADVRDADTDLAALLGKWGTIRLVQNDFVAAETAYRRALGIYTRARGPDDLKVADILDLVATALFNQENGRVLAGPLFFRAWAIRVKALGPDHPTVADSLHHLAVSLYFDHLPLAIPLFLRSMEIREHTFGHDHPLVADCLSTLALIYEMHNVQATAIPLYQEALAIREKVLGPEAADTMQVRVHLKRVSHIAGPPQ